MQNAQIMDVPFPLAGLEEYRAVTAGRVFDGRTSAATTQSCMNVRAIDPFTGRARGAARCGIDKFISSQISGTNPIQDLIHLTGSRSPSLGYTGQIAAAIHPDPSPGGNQPRGFGLFTPLLSQDASNASLPEGDTVNGSCWDQSGYVYFAYRVTATSKFTITKSDGASLTVQWTTTAFSATSGTTYLPLGIAVGGNVVYFYCATSGANNYELWRFDTATGANLDGGVAWKTQAAGQLSGLSQPAAGLATIDNCLAVSGDYIAVAEMTDTSNGFVRVFNSAGTQQSGSPIQVYGPKTASNSLWLNLIGDGENNFYWSAFTGGEAGYRVGRITPTGTSSRSSVGYSMAAYSPIAKQLFAIRTSPQVATLDNLTCTELNFVSVTGATWTHVHAKPDGGVVVIAPSGSWDIKIGATESNLVMLLSTFPITYGSIRNQFASVNQYQPAGADAKVFYRSGDVLAVSNGDVYRVSPYTGTASIVTQGNQAQWVAAPVVFSAQLLNRVYFTDGKNARYYDSTNNTMSYWSESSGRSSVPVDNFGNRARLIEAWRTRILLGGLPQEPNTLYASKAGTGTDFDYFPASSSPIQAFFKTFDDAINCMIAYNTDKALIGCDHSIFQITGDPMDGGSYDTLTNDVGMAWGRPYCQSMDGTIYFVGSRGGVYRIVPNSVPVSISSTTVTRRLEQVDYSTSIIRMAWDDAEQGFYLFITPTNSATATVHYFYHLPTNSWWPMQFSNVNHNGRVLYVIDGPSVADRYTLIGCVDGYIRKFNRSATTDDGTAISSYVYMGPLLNAGISEIDGTLALNSTSVNLSLHGGKSAEEALAAPAGWNGTLVAGRSYSHNPRRYERAQYMKLTGTGRWSLERLSVGIAAGTTAKHRRS